MLTIKTYEEDEKLYFRVLAGNGKQLAPGSSAPLRHGEARMSVWETRRETVQRGVDDDLTDEQIGALLGGLSSTSVWHGRKLLGIQRKPRKRKSFAQVFHPPVEAPPTGLETYVDEDGRTVTRCPTRYAAGVEMQTVTARPRR